VQHARALRAARARRRLFNLEELVAARLPRPMNGVRRSVLCVARQLLRWLLQCYRRGRPRRALLRGRALCSYVEDENAITDLDCDVSIIVDGMHGGASILHTRLVACSPRYTDGHAAATDSLPLMAVRTPHALTLWCTSGSLRHARVVLSERATHVTYCSTLDPLPAPRIDCSPSAPTALAWATRP
jgi:hypothetical protein